MISIPEDVAEALSGSYRLEREIGRGGMACVYLADDLKHSRKVAIKIMQPEIATTATGQERFRREIELAARLTHPHILTVHDSGIAAGHLYCVMPFISGETLRARLNRQKQLPVQECLRLFHDIAGALAYAHQHGIVHRDIKPENILLAEDIPLVADFGIARAVGAADSQALTQASLTETGFAVGTPLYMAPEQARGGNVDARADIYSLGCMLYEMLAGKPPFTGPTGAALVQQHLTARATPVNKIRKDLPASVATAIAKAMAKDPEERFASVTEFEEAVAAASKALEQKRSAFNRRAFALSATAIVLCLFAIGVVLWLLHRQSQLRWARETAMKKVEQLSAGGDIFGAYRIARQAIEIAPDDSRVKQTWTNLTEPVTVDSQPQGADVFIRNYLGRDQEWLHLGTTPMKGQRIALGLLRWRLMKPGYHALEVGQGLPELEFALVPESKTRTAMIFVPSSSFTLESTGETVSVPEFWLDQYEVTNQQYKAFVDAGGYRNRDFWKVPFEKEDRTLSWEEAMAEFVDTTGRPGPATWELGSYPEGKGNYPVEGVSWYEAAAYANYAHKQLPTAYHWYRASGAFGLFSEILQRSNFSEKGTAAVGTMGGIGPYGTYDMAGNVKEWCWNSTSADKRYILGGGWNEAAYLFRDEDAQPPMNRRAAFGFRCMWQKELVAPRLSAAIETFERDPSTIQPVSDELYEAYAHLYNYDQLPLELQQLHSDDSNPAWHEEWVSVRAAYGGERLPIRLLLPKNVSRPYQSVIYFPGSDAFHESSSQYMMLGYADFLVRGGRALVIPIYKGTYERQVPGPRGPNKYRDLFIADAKDIRRTIDYLETRRDIDSSRIALYGLSLGAQLAPLFLAIDSRLKTGVLLSGGFETWEIPAEVDPVNFAPHVREPVLMVNGREDFDLPYATAQVPLFHMLGTPADQKRHVVFEGGHIPPNPKEPIKVILNWLDEHLGPVQ
jgi:formylglycine-generating enzyme required for sulfatase activity/dienelactone hydrolase